MNRFPYILQRWHGPISVAFFVTEREVPALAEKIAAVPRQNVVYSVYVRRNTTIQNTPWHKLPSGLKRYFPKGVFPINLLRDLTIESISTSHYLVIDVDIFLSERIYDRINSYGHWLRDERLQRGVGAGGMSEKQVGAHSARQEDAEEGRESRRFRGGDALSRDGVLAG